MITRWPHLLVYALCAGTVLFAPAPRLTAQEPGSSASEPITAVIDVTQTGELIGPMMWGHFIENLSSYLEGGLWAELIGDRKFFYPVSNAPLEPPNGRSGWVNRWWPSGPEASVVMDSGRAYVGKHSPRVMLAGDGPRGIRQSSGSPTYPLDAMASLSEDGRAFRWPS